MSQQPTPGFDMISPASAAKMARIQSWTRGAQATASDPHSPSTSSSVSRPHSAPPSASPRSEAFDVRMMPAPPVPQVQVHLAEPRPVLHHKRSHVASLHSWTDSNRDVESQVGLRPDDRSTLGRELTWAERARRASRAFFGQPPLPPWRALNVEKHRPTPPLPTSQRESDINVQILPGRSKCECKCTKPRDPKRKRTRLCLCVILILLILLAVADVIFLNVRVFNPDFIISRPANPTPTNLSRDGTSTFAAPTTTQTRTNEASSTIPSTATITSAAASTSSTPSVLQSCLTQFQLNAPSSPDSYPCGTCFAALTAAPSDAGAGPAIQFCAMKAIFDSAGSSGSVNSNALSGVGWMRDAKPCGWSGITCDGNGNISNIVLIFPGVPAAIPSEITSLSALKSLKITGDGNIPAGSLPLVSSLNILELENTALTALSDDAFSSVKSLNSLTLVRNSKMGSNLPSSVGSLSLRSLIVNGQGVGSLDAIFSSASLASMLQTLDLSSNGITSALPSDLSGMTNLAELNLSGNDIASPFPTAMPPKIQVLSLQGNSKLSGTLPGSLCSSSALTSCDLRNTGLGGAGVTCGVCTFA